VLCIKTHREKKQNFTDKEFFDLVRAGFSHPRKQLWTNLAGQYAEVDFKNILHQIMGNEKVRAEELSVENWKNILEKMKS
jgi:16S rRNA A1518/A1519 N6-dimethyltransferase RsmA/KsgA/DIM1 with predicted DNA glycosylase/AP lyase activity